jgi:hypothetical protein
MDPIVFWQRADLVVVPQSDGWYRIHQPGESTGIVLDPVVAAIWSGANGQPATEIARSAQVSTYLALCTLAVLQRAGLLLGGASTEPITPENDPSPESRTAVSAIVVHRDSQADLHGCLASILGQEHPSPVEIIVVTTKPVRLDAYAVCLVQCQDATLMQTLDEQMRQAAGEAVLLLDSQISLAPGSLAEMACILALRDDIAAVAPRVMWKQWPGFVAYMGNWQSVADMDLNPYAGQLDVGQFGSRWQRMPAIHPTAGLIDRAIWQQGRWEREYDLDGIVADWSDQVLNRGYHVLAAAQALAYGPWPEWADLPEEQTGQVAHGEKRRSGWLPSGHGPMIHGGAPALMLDGVRSVYSQYPAIAPLPIRRRVAVLGKETSRRQTLVRGLATTCELNWTGPDVEEEIAQTRCQSADMVITTAECLAGFEFLQRWPRPVLLEAPPADGYIEPPESWLPAVDGLVCDNEQEGQVWLERLAKMEFTQPVSQQEGVIPGNRVVLLSAQDGSAARPSLAAFCRQPRMAPDRELSVFLGEDAVQSPPPPPTPVLALPAKAWQVLSQRGLRAALAEVIKYFRWRLGL